MEFQNGAATRNWSQCETIYISSKKWRATIVVLMLLRLYETCLRKRSCRVLDTQLLRKKIFPSIFQTFLWPPSGFRTLLLALLFSRPKCHWAVINKNYILDPLHTGHKRKFLQMKPSKRSQWRTLDNTYSMKSCPHQSEVRFLFDFSRSISFFLSSYFALWQVPDADTTGGFG